MRRLLLGMVLLVVAVVAIAAAVLTFLPTFGGSLAGERLARAKTSPQYKGDHFENPVPRTPRPSGFWWDAMQRQFRGEEVRTPPPDCPPVVQPVLAERTSAPTPGLRAVWFGHASVYLEIDGLRVMTDPVLSDYASPFRGIGPKRFHPPPVALVALPRIDAVVISHDHYDHLDMATIQHLARNKTRFFLPLGIGAHLERWGVPAAQITELDWWQSAKLNDHTFTSAPILHYSGRGLRDGNGTLWSAWAIAGPTHRVYFSGDTGFGPHFQEAGQRLGPFDLGILKVGAYGPGRPWIEIHMEPEEAVRAQVALGARRMLPIHWATFNLAFHAWDEPIRRTVAAARTANVDLLTPRLGEVVSMDAPNRSEAWWETCARAAAR